MQDELRRRVIAEREDERGWSIRTAAGKGAISPTAWSEFESGKRDLSKKMRAAVAQAFDWPTNWPSAPVVGGRGSNPTATPTRPAPGSSVESRRAEWEPIAADIADLARRLNLYVEDVCLEIEALRAEVAELSARRVAVVEPAPTTAANLRVAHRDRPSAATNPPPSEDLQVHGRSERSR